MKLKSQQRISQPLDMKVKENYRYIDPKLRGAIWLLNKHGIETLWCCQGNVEEEYGHNPLGYIVLNAGTIDKDLFYYLIKEQFYLHVGTPLVRRYNPIRIMLDMVMDDMHVVIESSDPKFNRRFGYHVKSALKKWIRSKQE